LEEHLNILRTSEDERLLRGSAFAFAGIIKGLGMATFQQYDILNVAQKEFFVKSASPSRK
jgi:hypothetical protein